MAALAVVPYCGVVCLIDLILLCFSLVPAVFPPPFSPFSACFLFPSVFASPCASAPARAAMVSAASLTSDVCSMSAFEGHDICHEGPLAGGPAGCLGNILGSALALNLLPCGRCALRLLHDQGSIHNGLHDPGVAIFLYDVFTRCSTLLCSSSRALPILADGADWTPWMGAMNFVATGR